MSIKVILNPRSDNGRGYQYRDAIYTAAQPLGGVDIVQTERPGHGETGCLRRI